MTHQDRRRFLMEMAGSAAAVSALRIDAFAAEPDQSTTQGNAAPGSGAAKTWDKPLIKFAVIGINHNHIYGQCNAVIRGGGQLVSVYAKEPNLLANFQKFFPWVTVAKNEDEILEDRSIALILTSGIPDERAGLAIRAMKAGKDFMSDKPGMTTLEQLAEVKKVQAETKRVYSILYSERHEVSSAIKAGELVQAGAIGKVVQTINLAPHRMNPKTRPEWFFQKARYGGILTDIGSHQAEQFLFYTGSTEFSIVSSQVGNLNNPQWPGLEDFGDMTLRGNGGMGYVRVDWFTPDGLSTWGDGRLFILGTDGYIELRKYVDVQGRPGGNHLFITDQKGMRYIDCSGIEMPYGKNLVQDILNRTETSMPQAHVFRTMQVVLEAEAKAQIITGKV